MNCIKYINIGIIMDESLKGRIKNQIFKFEVALTDSQDGDAEFTLDFEAGRYRQDELVGIIRDTVKFFALTENEIIDFDASEHYRIAYTRISDAHRNRKGDYGELLLFIILDIFFDTPKFVTKARLRTSTKEQIKGFDCAHFSINSNNEVILWLGEAKFYKEFSGAVSSAFESLNSFLKKPASLKDQLRLLGGQIEINKQLDPDKFRLLKSYVDGGRSLDSVSINVPVLITYDSDFIKSFSGRNLNLKSEEFKKGMTDEFNKQFKLIYNKKWPASANINIIFFLLPFESVEDIKNKIDVVEQGMRL